MRVFIFFILFYFVQDFSIASQNDCYQKHPTIHGNLKIQKILLGTKHDPSGKNQQTQNCTVVISPKNTSAPTRSYTFTEEGLFQLVNTLEKKSGSKTFFLFPRIQIPTYKLLPQGKVEVTTASGGRVIFSSKTVELGNYFKQVPFIESFSGMNYEQDPSPLATEKSFQIKSYIDPFLASEYMFGEAVLYKGDKSLFLFGKSKNLPRAVVRCEFKVNDFFYDSFIPDRRSPQNKPKVGTFWYPVWRNSNDTELSRYLMNKNLCKDMDLHALQHPERERNKIKNSPSGWRPLFAPRSAQ